MPPIRLGTRASSLARWQADWVAAQLCQVGVDVEIVPMTTAGDRRREAFGRIGGSGVFTKEIQKALLDGRIDLAVHSLKDLPTADVPGLTLAAVPERGPVGDVLVMKHREGIGGGVPQSLHDEKGTVPYGTTLGEESRPMAVWPLSLLLPEASVGTGSPRRKAQLLRLRPDLRIELLRGNVETRLRKLDQDAFDAILLAEAALRRLDDYKRGGGLYCWAEQAGCKAGDKDVRPFCFMVGVELVLPAVGQGALGVETRANDQSISRLVAPLDHPLTHAAVTAERAMLAALGGGCLAPVAAWARVEDNQLCLSGRVLSPDGRECVETTAKCPYPVELAGDDPFAFARQLGIDAAAVLLSQDAAALIAQARE